MIVDIEHTFVTADQHFGHGNVIDFCGRPFKHSEEMDAALVWHWNEIVGSEDTVYHLGDFTLGNKKAARLYFSQLNGYIKVLGNHWHHDRRWLPKQLGLAGYAGYLSQDGKPVEILPPLVVLEIPTKKEHATTIMLCHYPMAEWERKHYGCYHLHGHSHGNHKGSGLMMDIGVDCHNFYPVCLADVVAQMKAKSNAG